MSSATGGELAGRVALVTGGAGGSIGRATVNRLAQAGASVVMADSREERLSLLAGLGPVDRVDRVDRASRVSRTATNCTSRRSRW